MILPGRPIEDLKNDDEIFHVMYDLDDSVQIHGTRFHLGRLALLARYGCAEMESDP